MDHEVPKETAHVKLLDLNEKKKDLFNQCMQLNIKCHTKTHDVLLFQLDLVSFVKRYSFSYRFSFYYLF